MNCQRNCWVPYVWLTVALILVLATCIQCPEICFQDLVARRGIAHWWQLDSNTAHLLKLTYSLHHMTTLCHTSVISHLNTVWSQCVWISDFLLYSACYSRQIYLGMKFQTWLWPLYRLGWRWPRLCCIQTCWSRVWEMNSTILPQGMCMMSDSLRTVDRFSKWRSAKCFKERV